MKRLQELSKEINELTLKIEQDYPELYVFIEENPITIPNEEHPNMDIEVFTAYLHNLRDVLAKYIANHEQG